MHEVCLTVRPAPVVECHTDNVSGIFNYDVGIMPYRRPVNIVVGRPIKTKMAKSPDPAYVDELHKQYIDELLHLWSEWKDTFAPDRKNELQIIE